MDGFRVVRIDDVLGKIDLVIAATGNKHIITRERKMISKFVLLLLKILFLSSYTYKLHSLIIFCFTRVSCRTDKTWTRFLKQLIQHLHPKNIMCGLRKEDTVLRTLHAKGEWEKSGFLIDFPTLNRLPHLGEKPHKLHVSDQTGINQLKFLNHSLISLRLGRSSTGVCRPKS